jgi:hypothetical protein
MLVTAICAVLGGDGPSFAQTAKRGRAVSGPQAGEQVRSPVRRARARARRRAAIRRLRRMKLSRRRPPPAVAAEAEVPGPEPELAAEAPVEGPDGPPGGAAGDPVAGPADPSQVSRDATLFAEAAPPAAAAEPAPEDPLRIGGLVYLRARSAHPDSGDPRQWSMSAPNLVDTYLDARPNDRVRAFILGRMLFDPTRTASGAAPVGAGSMAPPPDASGPGRPGRPEVSLDQLWVRFDLGRVVFVTAGKQHARWGTGRVWNPSDFLHVQPRDPLDVFDARSGTTMLKLHLPWEAQGWNLYAYGILEDARPTTSAAQVGGAGRLEIVLGTMEVGMGGLVRQGRRPRMGFDVSLGVWDLDVYAEVALRFAEEIDRIRRAPEVVIGPEAGVDQVPASLDLLFPSYRDRGLKAQTVVGLSYSRKYNDDDVFHVALEYFDNPLGYASADVYPGLGLAIPRLTPLEEGPRFFYLGQRYAAAMIKVPAPYSLDYTSFGLSLLANLSDRSWVARLDYGLTLLTHVQLEAYGAVHQGRPEGEFRFGIERLPLGSVTISVPPGLFEVGLAVRVQF